MDANKAVALGVYFRSRQADTVLATIFTMPSPSTLTRFVCGVSTVVGFSETIFELLEVKSKSMTDSEWCCIILFDEMSYDRACDTVDGLLGVALEEEGAMQRSPGVHGARLDGAMEADLGFFFAHNATGAADLRRLLTILVEKLTLAIQLKPMAVVCDQASTNRSLYGSIL